MSKEDDLLAYIANLPFVRESQRLKNSDRLEDNFLAEPAQTALRHIKVSVDHLVRSNLAEPDKESVRKAFGALEELVKTAEDEDVESFATPSARYLDLNLIVARVILASFFIGLLCPSRQSTDLIGRARLRGARKKKAAGRVNDPVMQVIASIWRANANKNPSGKAMIGLAHKELKKKNLRVPSDSTIYRYLKELKSPRS
jgi:hypothetical protein